MERRREAVREQEKERDIEKAAEERSREELDVQNMQEARREHMERERDEKHLEEPVASSTGPRFICVKPLTELSDPEEKSEEEQESSTGGEEENIPQKEPEEEPKDIKTEKMKKVLLRPLPMGRMTECFVERDRENRDNPVYRLYREEGDSKELLMIARRIGHQNTYKIRLGDSSAGGSILGQLRYNWKFTEFSLNVKRGQPEYPTEVTTIHYVSNK
ncbi:hypothetical protein AMEX_G169 [Astyanax mexicanus]|uniref:Tubby C-terminal domain-containing protein n=2 Tax=Astyanax mexicanus TaxID=7994 RepID=A0A8T2MJG7_ASTMX|nr:hypothetical protein AMEX_G169 [Astyanax mexicanus]